jgi:thiaminase/transcriptional activator TenA
MDGNVPFHEELWSEAAPIMDRILSHPFVVGLTDGSLPEEAFRFYVLQDALYLRDFARGLALLGAKAPRDRWMTTFFSHARDALEVERALHKEFFTQWGITEEDLHRTPMAPTNLLYTSYLIRVAYECPFHEALGAYLPCYWIYWEVGKALEKRGSPNPLYRRWIETYSSEQYAHIVKDVINVMDSLAQDLTELQREGVKVHFIVTSKMEYLFWQMAYEMEGWRI